MLIAASKNKSEKKERFSLVSGGVYEFQVGINFRLRKEVAVSRYDSMNKGAWILLILLVIDSVTGILSSIAQILINLKGKGTQ